MNELTWEQTGELLEAAAEETRFFYRLSFLPNRKQWICSIDGIEARADDPKTAIHLATAKFSAHAEDVPTDLKVGKDLFLIAADGTVEKHKIMKFDEENVYFKIVNFQNLYEPYLVRSLKSYGDEWFTSHEEAIMYLNQTIR